MHSVMRKILFVMLATGIVMIATRANAQNANCSFIADPDQRNYCMARAGSPSNCSFIQNNDLRNLCRAEVTGNRQQCSFIQNANQRNYCMATVR